MRFVSRNDWGARPPRDRASIGRVYGVTVHWAGPSPYINTHRDCGDTVRSFQRYHMDEHGWNDLGYSALSCPHGYVFEGRGLGIRGAHAGESDIGGNTHWYGLCALIGQGDPVTGDLLDALRDAIAWMRSQGDAGDRVNGHRDHHATQCPGDELYAWAHGSPMEDDDMPLNSDDLDAIAQRVWAHDIPTPHNRDNQEMHAGVVLGQTHNRAGGARREAHEDQTVYTDDMLSLLRSIETQAGTGQVDVEALAGLLAPKLGLDVSDVKAAVREVLREGVA